MNKNQDKQEFITNLIAILSQNHKKNFHEIANFLGITKKHLICILHGQKRFCNRNIKLLQAFISMLEAQVKKENGGLVNENN